MNYGIVNIKPKIKKVKVELRKLQVSLEDGRIITIPKKYFPFIKGDPGKIYIAGGEQGDVIIFDNYPEVIHIEEILGRWEDYRYKG